MTALPEVPVGTVLRLSPGEWYAKPGQLPVFARADITVTRVHPKVDDLGAVWVTGHAIECAWESSECTVPCMELLVRVSAIVRQVPSL